MTGWLWIATALADPPDRLARLWPINTSAGLEVERMAVSEFGDLIVGRTRGDLKGWLLDVNAWTLQTFGSCDVTGVAPLRTSYDGGERWEIWMSCGDGSIQALTYDGGALSPLLDDAGEPIQFTGVDDTLSGLWVSPAQMLYAISVPSESGGLEAAVVHVVDPFALTVDSAVYGGYPAPLTDTTFNEAVIVDGRMFVSHGGASMSTLLLDQPSPSPLPDTSGPSFRCDDLAPTPLGVAYCVDSGVDGGLGAAYQYNPSTSQFLPLGLGTLPDPAAICVSEDLSDGWLAITGLQVKVWEMDDDGTIPSTTPYFEGDEDADNPIQDMTTSEGYLYGGGTEGVLHVVTARPWLPPADMQIVPDKLTAGESATISFTVNEDASYTLYLGGDRYGSGEELVSGDVLEGEQGSAVITADDRFEEGDNFIYVIATSDTSDLTGHGRVTVNVDNPPDPPTLTDGNVQFADGALLLSFDGIPDADLLQYEIYVSDQPFNAADWPSGGPAAPGTLKTPIVVASEPGARVTHRIAPLTNETTYYIGVHARDAGDKEGPMSKVVKGTPHETYTAAELAGETGGAPCSTGPRGSGWVALLAAGLLSRRSRRASSLAALLVALSVPGLAQAQGRDDDDDPWWRQDMTPARANFEIRYGTISLLDERLDLVYRDAPHNLLQAEVGPQLFRYAEVDFGFGFFQELAKTTTEDGSLQSGEVTMLTWFPFSLDATARAHVLDEQPAVPFFRYGWDYVLWSEKSDNGLGGKDTIRGAKFGTHTGLGVDLLLDLLSPGRASFLEAQTGINDSWLTIEWRNQHIDGRKRPWSGRTESGLDFSGSALMFGLKLDW